MIALLKRCLAVTAALVAAGCAMPGAADAFLAGQLDATADVKNILIARAKGRSDVRLIEPAFMTIGQAAGVPQGRPSATAFLRRFIEEQKASGFDERALRESNVTDAVVAPSAR